MVGDTYTNSSGTFHLVVYDVDKKIYSNYCTSVAVITVYKIT